MRVISAKITGMSDRIGHAGQKTPYLLWELPGIPFDYTYLMNRLRDYVSPRDKISRMIQKGEIIQIKRGLYVLSPQFGPPINRRILANLIYGPSYISLEYALSYWGLIPEKVEVVTSMTTRRNKVFETPVGIFSYHYLKNSKFSVGIDRIVEGKASFFIASKEKALCDRLTLESKLTKADMADFLSLDLRVDMGEVKNMDIRLIQKIEKVYRKGSVTAFLKWLLKNQ